MTIKQAEALKKIAENHGNVSRTMLEVGYSPNTAKKPSNLTDSKAWKKAMETQLPDDKLLEAHSDALTAMKWNDFTGEREKDHQVRLKAVELGYKVKGRLQSGNTFNVEEQKILVIPSELIDKYAISSDAEPSSEGQAPV